MSFTIPSCVKEKRKWCGKEKRKWFGNKSRLRRPRCPWQSPPVCVFIYVLYVYRFCWVLHMCMDVWKQVTSVSPGKKVKMSLTKRMTKALYVPVRCARVCLWCVSEGEGGREGGREGVRERDREGVDLAPLLRVCVCVRARVYAICYREGERRGEWVRKRGTYIYIYIYILHQVQAPKKK